MRFKKVAVLMGGVSAERDVSLASGEAVAGGLERSGYAVTRIDAGDRVDEALREARVEAAYIALHGRLGEDGTIQGLLEMMRIPYTGSSVLASAVAMDKELTRNILASRGVPIPKGFLVDPETPGVLPEGWQVPVVVKPADEGSSFGVTIVRERAGYAAAVANALGHSRRVLVEEFVRGTEITAAVLDGRVLGTLEIEAHSDFYDFSAKYDDGGSTHHIPARINAKQDEQARRFARTAFEALLCSGAARVDFIVSPGGPPVALELNTIPGMTRTSLLPEIAAHAGIAFDQLVSTIMEGARLHVPTGRKDKISGREG